MKIQILVENTVYPRGLQAEHGLSLWIEKDDCRVLFDLGESGLFRNNAAQLGIDLSRTDHIVISHGHYDHGGGIGHFPWQDVMPAIHLHPRTLAPKGVIRSREPLLVAEAGMGEYWPDEAEHQEAVSWHREMDEIAPGIFVAADIPLLHGQETIPAAFVVPTQQGWEQDTFSDEQMLLVTAENRLAVCLGCSHRGIINSLDHARRLFPDHVLDTVVAGMHLHDADEERLDWTIERLQAMNIRQLVPVHCTGFSATARMKHEFGERCLLAHVGDTICC